MRGLVNPLFRRTLREAASQPAEIGSLVNVLINFTRFGFNGALTLRLAMAARGRGEEGTEFGPGLFRDIPRPPYQSYPTLEGSSPKNRTKFNPCGMERTRTFTRRLRADEFSQDKARPDPMNSLSLSAACVLSSKKIICQQVGRCS